MQVPVGAVLNIQEPHGYDSALRCDTMSSQPAKISNAYANLDYVVRMAPSLVMPAIGEPSAKASPFDVNVAPCPNTSNGGGGFSYWPTAKPIADSAVRV
jgi:hypothetical protein